MAKRARLQEDFEHEVMKEAVTEAMEEDFPWTGALGGPVGAYIQTLANAKNAPPEFVLLGLLVSASAAMGPNTCIAPQPEYEEPVNLYVVCVGPAGAGKTQSLQLAVHQPVSSIVSSWNRHAIVDDFTREGFRKQLVANLGRVIFASDEMAALLENIDKKCKSVGPSADRHLFCRLFDATTWTRTTGQGSTLRIETIRRSHVCTYGFIQPYPFITKVLPTIIAEEDGLYDRFLVCAPKVQKQDMRALAESVQAKAMLPEHMRDFTAILQAVNDVHDRLESIEYVLSAEALERFTAFDCERVAHFNATLGLDSMAASTKDSRYVLRLACVISVLSQTINVLLHTEAVGPYTPLIRKCVSADVMYSAIQLTRYCSGQRQIFDAALRSMQLSTVSQPAQLWTLQDLQTKILVMPGPFTTGRTVSRRVPRSQNVFAQQNSSLAMERLQACGLGKVCYAHSNSVVYHKPLPTDENRQAVEEFLLGKHSWEHYVHQFTATSSAIFTPKQFNTLLQSSPYLARLKDTYKIQEVH